MLMKRLLTGILTLLILTAVTGTIILYGRGYRFDLKKKSVEPTGTLVATSSPDGALVYIDDKPAGATNTTIPLAPGWYTVKISKDGYISWEKKLHIEGEVVSKTDALLFPVNPSLSPLTHGSVEQFATSPDGSKLAFISRDIPRTSVSALPDPITPSLTPQTTSLSPVSPIRARDGIYILDLNDNPLVINRYPRQILDFSTLPITSQLITHKQRPITNNQNPTTDNRQLTTLVWSPDSKQVLFLVWASQINNSQLNRRPTQLQSTDLISEAYLLDANRINTIPNTTNQTANILSTWQQEKSAKQTEQISAFPPQLQRLATTSATIVSFSPDETKILYQGTRADTLSKVFKTPLIGTNPTTEDRTIRTNNFYIYDLKEDKNYHILDWIPPSNKPIMAAEKSPRQDLQAVFQQEYPDLVPDQYYPLHWYPDSRHLIHIDNNRIILIDFDGTNTRSVYAGPFVNGYVAPWPSGGRLVILTSLNADANNQPSLYSLNIK